MRRFILLLPLVLLWPAVAMAQTPVPVTAATGVSFSDADHTATNTDGTPKIARYELRFLPAVGCAAVPAFNLAKPTPDAAGVITVKPIATFGTLPANCVYTSTVAAIGPTGLEGVSVATVPFVRAVPLIPAAPSRPTVLP